MNSLEAPIVCVVTRARGERGSQERAQLLRRLARAAEAGASMIQIRERQMDDRTLLDFTKELLASTRNTGCLVLVNDRVDIAIAAGAAGVHIKSNGVTAADVRSLAPDRFVIGRSIHSADEAVAAEREGGYAYVLFGTVFPSASKSPEHAIAGVEMLRDVCSRTSLPVVAIGGITPSRAAEVARAGATGAAAIAYFAEAPDTAEAVASLKAALTRFRDRV